MRAIDKKFEILSRRRGLTIVEVIFILALITLSTFAILMPAVMSAREAARRAQCVGNLKGIMLAVRNYESTCGFVPPAGTLRPVNSSGSFSAFARITPYLGLSHTGLVNSLNFEIAPEIQTTVTHAIVEILACPSDPKSYPLTLRAHYGQPVPENEVRTTLERPYPINYGVNLGTWRIHDPQERWATGDGAFAFDASIRLDDFTDGSSNTIGVAECYSWQPVLEGNGNPAANDTPPPIFPGQIAAFGGNYEANRGHSSWAIGDPLQTGMTTTFTPNAFVPANHRGRISSVDFISVLHGHSQAAPVYAAITSRSYHQDGIDAGMMDGSVRRFSDSIESRIWRALGTRAGHEVISAEGY